MPTWLELLLLAIASMFWPTLIVIVVVALRLKYPVKTLFWFLVGGLLMTVTVGIFIVFELQGAISSSQSSVSPTVDVVVGVLSLAVAYLMHRRAARTPPPSPASARNDQRKPSAAERAVGGGAAVAFAAGVVLNILPGTFPIVALKDIAEMSATDGVKVTAIVLFYLIMFAFVEVPIIAYQFAPQRTTMTVNATNSWLARNKLHVAVWVMAGVGVYLIARGVIDALT